MDMAGWRSLCRISSSLTEDNDVLPFDRLAEETDGLLCLTGGRRGALARLVAANQTEMAENWISQLERAVQRANLHRATEPHAGRLASYV